jgi:hypothetical protein
MIGQSDPTDWWPKVQAIDPHDWPLKPQALILHLLEFGGQLAHYLHAEGFAR